MRSAIFVAVFFVGTTLISKMAAADMIMTFEDVTPLQPFPVGSTITSGGLSLVVNGGPSANTLTQVVPNGFFGQGRGLQSAADRELVLQLPIPLDMASFQFGNFGGTAFLRINGVTSPLVAGFDELDGTVIDGVSIATSGTRINGMLQMDGAINSLTISGEELLVDNIAVSAVPEPSAMGLVVMGLLFTIGRARRY